MDLVNAVALTGTASQAVATKAAQFAGITIHSSGGAAIVRVWDNPSAATGTLLGAYDLSASGTGSWVDLVYDRAKQALTGLYVELVSGHVEGSVYIL